MIMIPSTKEKIMPDVHLDYEPPRVIRLCRDGRAGCEGGHSLYQNCLTGIGYSFRGMMKFKPLPPPSMLS